MPKSYFAQVLSPDFLVWKIVNLGMTFAVCSKLNVSLQLTPERMYARLVPEKNQTKLICDSPDSLRDKTDYLNNVFSKNNFNTDFVRRNTHSNTDSKTKTNVNSGFYTTATIPYIRGTYEGLPGVLGNKGTSPFTFREQGIFQNNF